LGVQRTPPWAFVAVLAVAATLPFFVTSKYLLGVLVLSLIYSILNLAWNLTIGISGIWNFGQLALFASGGYAYGILGTRYDLPPWLALGAGALVGAAFGIVMIVPALRLRGIYAALLTFAFAEVFRLIIVNDNSGLTGGPYGLSSIPGLFSGASATLEQRGYYWVALAGAVFTAWTLKRLVDSPTGLALQALRDSTPYAIGMGTNRRASILVSTAVSGFLSGLAGALYAGYYEGISPVVMGLAPLSLFVLMIVIGGLGRLYGPALGTFVVMLLSELLRDFDQWRFIVLGAILLVILAFQPTGLSGLLSRGVASLRRWMAEDDHAGEGEKPGKTQD
jgi:branched-chain amino acid transport system permease protein